VKEKPQPDEIQHLEWNHLASRAGSEQCYMWARELRRIIFLRRWINSSGQDSSPIHSGLLLCLVGKTIRLLAIRGGPE
jgi:hypothetical protein